MNWVWIKCEWPNFTQFRITCKYDDRKRGAAVETTQLAGMSIVERPVSASASSSIRVSRECAWNDIVRSVVHPQRHSASIVSIVREITIVWRDDEKKVCSGKIWRRQPSVKTTDWIMLLCANVDTTRNNHMIGLFKIAHDPTFALGHEKAFTQWEVRVDSDEANCPPVTKCYCTNVDQRAGEINGRQCWCCKCRLFNPNNVRLWFKHNTG